MSMTSSESTARSATTSATPCCGSSARRFSAFSIPKRCSPATGAAFVVFVQSISARNAAILAERIRCTINDLPLITQGKKFRVTVSIGVAWAGAAEPQHGSALVERAERAMREAKSSGKNHVSIDIVE